MFFEIQFNRACLISLELSSARLVKCYLSFSRFNLNVFIYSHTDSIWHVFEFNGVEVCPTLEEFSAIMEEPSVNDLVFPTMCGDLPTLIQALLGVPLEKPKQWCIFSKMNVRLIFAYFSRLTIPTTDIPCSQFLNAFCLCILASYFLVHGTPCVDLRMCLVGVDLRNRNIAGMIFAKTLNGLD